MGALLAHARVVCRMKAYFYMPRVMAAAQVQKWEAACGQAAARHDKNGYTGRANMPISSW